MGKNGEAKLADFSVSSFIRDNNDITRTTEGTAYFMSPEMCNIETCKAGFSGKISDIWSLGITFFSFTFLELPFFDPEETKLYKLI